MIVTPLTSGSGDDDGSGGVYDEGAHNNGGYTHDHNSGYVCDNDDAFYDAYWQ